MLQCHFNALITLYAAVPIVFNAFHRNKEDSPVESTTRQ